MSQTLSTDRSHTLGEARRNACLEAAWELECLALHLPNAVPRDVEGGYLVVRGIAARMKALAAALITGLDDDTVSDGDLERLVMLPTNSE